MLLLLFHKLFLIISNWTADCANTCLFPTRPLCPCRREFVKATAGDVGPCPDQWGSKPGHNTIIFKFFVFFFSQSSHLTVFHRINKGYFINYTPSSSALFLIHRGSHKKVLWCGLLWSHCPHTCDLA